MAARTPGAPGTYPDGSAPPADRPRWFPPPTGRETGLVVRVVVVAVAVVVLLLALVWLAQRKLIYLPATGPVAPAHTVIPGAEDVELRTGDGLVLGAWH